MNEPEKQVQNLIRLKRFEKPRDEYFEDFLEEFQSRRDEEEALKPSTVSLGARLADFFDRMNPGKWVVGAGVAYAALMLVVFSWPKGPETRPDPSRKPVVFEPKQPVRKPVTPPKNPVIKPGS